MMVWKKWGEWEYQNRGSDPRAGGFLGQVFAMVQTLGSWHSPNPPKKFGGDRFAIFWPPFIGIAIPYGHPAKFATFRAGFRWDNNWPGYILDVIIKLKMPLVPF